MEQDRTTLKSILKTLNTEIKAGLGFSFFINLLMLVSPIFMLQVYDRVLPSRSELTLLMLLLLAIFLLSVMGILDTLRHKLMSKSAAKLDDRLAPLVFQSVVNLNRVKPNSASSNYFQDIASIKQFVAGQPICVFFDAPWVPLFILCNYLIHPLLGTITLLAALTIFAIAFINEKLSRGPTEKAQQAQSRSQHYVSDGIAHIETVSALGMTKELEHNWLKLHNKANEQNNISNSQAGAFSASTKAYRLCLQTLILAAGGWLAIDQTITPGAMIAASIIMGRALAPVEQAIGTWRIFVKARVSYQRLDKLIKSFPSPQSKIEHQRPTGNLTADKLIVVPPNSDKPVLKGLSFQLPAGKSLMISGASGSGKSTLSRTLAGIWSPYSGKVELDSIDLKQWNTEDLGQYIGYLSQQVDFLPGTIAQNIARFHDCEDTEIIQAAKLAGVHEQITQLKDGYDTMLDSNASMLSAGQKQLVGLARSVFRKPSLVVLDEPNAHLDKHGDQLFIRLIRNLKQEGITTVVVSHKDNILPHVDFYLEIKLGQTALFGPTSELTKSNPKRMESVS